MASLYTLFLYSDVDEGEGGIMKKVTNGDIRGTGGEVKSGVFEVTSFLKGL